MSTMPAPHPTEFRRHAVELARSGDASIATVAKQLTISESCLRNWIAQADADEKGSENRLTSAEKRELAQLRRDKKRLEMENDTRLGLALLVACPDSTT
jgi:transposase-like protein